MHSDGAAKSWVDPATDKTLNGRMDAACAAEHPSRALHALARALRDEGLSQQELYALFESHRAWNDALDSMLLTGVRKPAEPSTWLEPSGEAPLQFRVQGAGNEAVRFVPYYLIQEELFEVYPAV